MCQFGAHLTDFEGCNTRLITIMADKKLCIAKLLYLFCHRKL